jgi:uncharacterized protein (DUF1499 family)
MLRPTAVTEGTPLENPSRVASLASHLGVAGVLALALGVIAIHLRAVSPFLGFRIFLLGGLCGLLALLVGALGLWRTRASTGREGRGRALRGALLGAAVLGLIVASAGSARGLPRINDITTNPDDPPLFVHAGSLPGNEGHDLAYPGASFAEQQRAGYPDLAPIVLPVAPPEAFERARRAAEALGWQVTHADAAAGLLEATETSRIFRFVDDIVVRLRADGAGSVVDVRSKSRVGQGDMGANANRIRAFRSRITAS